MNPVIDFLLKKWPYAFWLLVGGFAVWMYFLVANKASKAKKSADDAHKKIDNLPCDKHKEYIENQKDNYRDLDLKIEKMGYGIEYMAKSVSDMSRGLIAVSEKLKLNVIPATPLTQTMSPLTLTERGNAKVSELGIDYMIDNNWDKISSLIEEKSESKNPYDIQQLCTEEALLFPEKFLNQNDIDKLKHDAYLNGEIFQSYMRVIAVLVRDRFFDEHNIDISGVDKNDPNMEYTH